MLRRSVWMSVVMFAGSSLMLSGCADPGPKPGGVTTVAPATKPGTTPTTPPAATDTPPAGKDAPQTSTDTRTTGGGTETPSTPGNGQ